MELQKFNTKNTGHVRKRGTTVRIHMKVGTVQFSKEALIKLGLKEGDRIDVFQDKQEPENWYLEKVEEDGFLLRAKGVDKSGLIFNSTTLVRLIAKSVGYYEISGKMNIAGEPTIYEDRTLWGLIASTLRM